MPLKPSKFVSQTFFHASTRLENKVPIPIPKLLVQDQDLCKTLTCLDRYHNDMADHLLPLNFIPQNAGFLGLNETDFQNRNTGF
ncbi:unnamed protein product [Rhizophagus irregularis]|nr:unnamed protein product [Rhizophagus irregularis]